MKLEDQKNRLHSCISMRRMGSDINKMLFLRVLGSSWPACQRNGYDFFFALRWGCWKLTASVGISASFHKTVTESVFMLCLIADNLECSELAPSRCKKDVCGGQGGVGRNNNSTHFAVKLSYSFWKYLQFSCYLTGCSKSQFQQIFAWYLFFFFFFFSPPFPPLLSLLFQKVCEIFVSDCPHRNEAL